MKENTEENVAEAYLFVLALKTLCWGKNKSLRGRNTPAKTSAVTVS